MTLPTDPVVAERITTDLARLAALELVQAQTAHHRQRAACWRAAGEMLRGRWGGPVALAVVGGAVLVGLAVAGDDVDVSRIVELVLGALPGAQCPVPP